MSHLSCRRTCWVCFGTDEDVVLDWVRPCQCRGTARWVHVRCLQRWIDEKQRNDPIAEVHCPQCNEKYKIVYPKMGALFRRAISWCADQCSANFVHWKYVTGLPMRVLDLIEKYINKSCPIVAASILVGSVYWTAVTYGAVTVMQVSSCY